MQWLIQAGAREARAPPCFVGQYILYIRIDRIISMKIVFCAPPPISNSILSRYLSSLPFIPSSFFKCMSIFLGKVVYDCHHSCIIDDYYMYILSGRVIQLCSTPSSIQGNIKGHRRWMRSTFVRNKEAQWKGTESTLYSTGVIGMFTLARKILISLSGGWLLSTAKLETNLCILVSRHLLIFRYILNGSDILTCFISSRNVVFIIIIGLRTFSGLPGGGAYFRQGHLLLSLLMHHWY